MFTICSWVAYEKPEFEGHQYLLEEGEYQEWTDWGGYDEQLQSLRPVLGVSLRIYNLGIDLKKCNVPFSSFAEQFFSSLLSSSHYTYASLPSSVKISWQKVCLRKSESFAGS